jgi:hypothetical protein
MGACDFAVVARGKDAKDAFSRAVQDARYENGHGGYTGTIAEKHDFINVGTAITEDAAFKRSQELLDADDKRISDKWGPAGCIVIDGSTKDGTTLYLFFGWASS